MRGELRMKTPLANRIAASMLIGLALGPLPAGADLAEDFTARVRPVLERECFDCHNENKQKGDLNLVRFNDFASVKAEPELWQHVLERVQSAEMPPKKAGKLDYGDLQLLMKWLRKVPKPKDVDCTQIASDRTASYYRGYVMSRRLNRAEYMNTVNDLFGVEFDIPFDQILPKDGSGGEGFDTAGNALFLSSIHIEKYLESADQVTRAILPDNRRELSPAMRRAREELLVSAPGILTRTDQAARDVLKPLVTRAWRRPVDDQEIDQLMTLFDRARERGDSFEQSLRLPIKAALVSPHFLFLAEPEPTETGVQRLSGIPLANKLSYFIWSSMPDEELMKLAQQGQLQDTNVYRAQIQRMLRDPKAQSLGERFALQWLDLEQLGVDIKPDSDKFPQFDDDLAQAMKMEVATFFNNLISNDRSLLELLDSDYTFVNERLARIYGIDDVAGDGFRRVQLTDVNRGGLLGMAGVHALTSYPLRTSPVLRGRWVLESLLGDRIPPPPPDVPALDEEKMSTEGLTLRRQLEIHRENPDCAGCHDKMDPLGFGLENFDVLGRWRTEDHGQPLDTQGTLPSGETYEGPTGLKQLLLAKEEKIIRHMTKKMIGFAFGRQLNKFDRCVIDETVAALQKSDYRASVLIESIAMSYPFQYRFYARTED